MRIVSCFSRTDEIGPLAEAGADELYCAIADVPAHGFGPLRGGLRRAAALAHSLGLKLSLAANSMRMTFTAREFTAFADRLRRAADEGVDAFIVANPSVFELFRELKERLPVPVHLSSVQPCFNSLTARYFLRLGVSRIILPGQLAPSEARGIFRECRAAGAETEIFDYRFFGCVYVNGRCNLHDPVFHTFTSGDEGDGLCRCGSSAGGLRVRPERPGGADAALTASLTRRLYARMGCGGPPRLANAASFYDLFLMGTDYLKYGTRRDPSGVKVRKVRELRSMLELAQELRRNLPRAAAKAEFVRRMSAWRGLPGEAA